MIVNSTNNSNNFPMFKLTLLDFILFIIIIKLTLIFINFAFIKNYKLFFEYNILVYMLCNLFSFTHG
jgi:hypothetical protein